MEVNDLFSCKEIIQYVFCKSLEKPATITVEGYRYICILSLNTFLQICELIQRSQN